MPALPPMFDRIVEKVRYRVEQEVAIGANIQSRVTGDIDASALGLRSCIEQFGHLGRDVTKVHDAKARRPIGGFDL